MSNIDWLEKRRRAARCKLHGLHYDPSMTSGCILCRKEGLLREKPKGPQLIMLLLALLGMSIAIFQIYKPVTDTVRNAFGEPESEAQEAPPPPRLDKIDPAPLQPELQRFERALLTPPSDELSGIRDDLSTAGQILTLRLSELRSPLGLQIAEELTGLLQTIDPTPVDLAKVTEIRQGWFEIRARRFESAPWFLSPATGSDLDRVQLVVYREIANDLQVLIDGVQRAQATSSAVEPPAADELLRSWQVELDELQQRFPERPSPSIDAEILLIFQQLERALSDLGRLATATDLAAVSRAHLEDLELRVDRASRDLDDLLL